MDGFGMEAAVLIALYQQYALYPIIAARNSRQCDRPAHYTAPQTILHKKAHRQYYIEITLGPKPFMKWPLADVFDSVYHSSVPVFGEKFELRRSEHTCFPTATCQYSENPGIREHLVYPRNLFL
jgi:acetyl esterase/lipase